MMIKVLSVAAFAGILVVAARGDSTPPGTSVAQGWVYSLLEENDLFVQTDRSYTQGIKMNLLPPEVARADGERGSFSWLPTLGYDLQFVRVGYGVGQNIYTPGDISVPTLITTDRPYAGWLYFSTMFHRRGQGPLGAVLESLEIDLGVVGMWALAGEAQTWVHEIRSFQIPQGWTHQLSNEPGVRIKLLRAERWRLFNRENAINLDFIPHVGASVGTVENSFQIGALARLGVNLPDDFGVRTIDSLTTATGGYDASWRHCFGFYLYAGALGRAVAWNTFLDGNIFRNSHRVDKEAIGGDVVVGGVVVFRRLEIGFAQTLRAREYVGEGDRHEFGSVFAKLKF